MVEMKPPTQAEFETARQLAKVDESAKGEDAYQVCRWFRGEVFYRSQAEVALKKIRTAARRRGSP
jgi:hypothetical protein